ncbi:hypothetical protein GOP47_0030283 [Adiantum capillus-veneris]|nr:hypothetical protein GOP47_0030283 [Adiantum capillus-veneris]
MSQIGRAYNSFKAHLKVKLRSSSAQALLGLALLLLIFVSLVTPQLLRVPRSVIEQKDRDEWYLKPAIRPQSRELKAEYEAIATRQNNAEVLVQPVAAVLQPFPIPFDESTEIGGDDLKTDSSAIYKANDDDKQGNEVPLVSGNRKNVRVKGLRKTANLAWRAGKKAWKELESVSNHTNFAPPISEKKDIRECPKSIIMEGQVLRDSLGYMKLPCGLTIGSSIAVVGIPRGPHNESKTTIGHIGNPGSLLTQVSQFMFELHGPKPFGYEEPSRILHINPRLKGDWSEKPVIELNSFTKGLWGRSQRCDGSRSQYQEKVEGLLNCERWIQEDGDGDEPSWWLRRLIERKEKPEMSWRYPFVQKRSFILTVRAGLEGYHMSVDGKHVSSFRYQPGLSEEITVASYVGGDVDLQALIATSLPSVPPKTVTEQIFENWQQWKAPKLGNQPLSLFIGILSSSNHFAERMAIRSTWFQDRRIQSAEVVARFFVALHRDTEINIQMKKEAEYYGDMVILPFMDEYDLVVLKTLAICEYGIRNVTTKYIMKCDDDTFIRVDAVLDELMTVKQAESLYMGNMNMFHRPLRMGKWAVTFEEWPDEEYPTYANGPGYIISRNIASFILAQKRRKELELFKMEDVSMGLWVKQYQQSGESVQYVNIWKFFQSGCEDGYIIAHYQSPRHMLCLHKKLLKGDANCCH